MELALSLGAHPSKKRATCCGGNEEMKVGSLNCGPVQLDLKHFWSSGSVPTDSVGDANEEHELAVSGSGDGIKPFPCLWALSFDSRPEGVAGKPCSGDAERASSGCSDEEESGTTTRKRLRLSKEQACFLEQSFKENPTINPKQKLALAKQLSLQPRQVEVWFQNRRARNKVKQTEVDCEYLRRWCESLTEENRRLRKELQDLKTVKAPHHPHTKLTMCPSCEWVSFNNSSGSGGGSSISTSNGDGS